jgi:flagellar basal-body rod protein FlgB
MPMKSLFAKTYGVIERSLEIANVRHGMIAGNVANLSTPGYKSKDLNFDKALQDAMSKRSIPMERTHPLHFGTKAPGMTDYDVIEAQHAGVDIDHEMSKLAENNLRYQAGIEALLRKFAGLKHTITEGGR